MTIREVQCLLMLFAACPDEAIRLRAIKLVPDLAEGEATQSAEPCRRWRLSASVDGVEIGSDVAVCRESDLEPHRANLRQRFDLAVGLVISAEALC